MKPRPPSSDCVSRATTTGIFIRNTSGMPGSSHVFSKRIVGQVTSAVTSSAAPSGTSAMRKCPAVHRSR
jgi:hypothetical protein